MFGDLPSVEMAEEVWVVAAQMTLPVLAEVQHLLRSVQVELRSGLEPPKAEGLFLDVAEPGVPQ
jgi:hypothetical protein